MGGPADNRFTVFDAPCAAAGCRDFGLPQVLVNTANLNLFVRVADLSFGGPAPALALEHSYNSDDSRQGPLGNGWSLSLDESLTQGADGSWTVRRESGRVDRFGPAFDPGQFFAITQTADVLSRNADGGFSLRNPQTGTVRIFRGDGRLGSIQDSGVTRVALTYDGAGRLTAAQSRGGSIRFDYAGAQISAATDSAGRSVTFGYDGQGNLVSQTNADGSVVTYGYDDSGRLASISTSGGQTTISYATDGSFTSVAGVSLADGSGKQYAIVGVRQARVTDGAGNATTYASGVTGQVESITDAAGNVTTYTYDGSGHRTSTTTANGGTLQFAYDGAGNLIRITDPARNQWTAGYNGTLLGGVTDAGGNNWFFGYDGNTGRLTSVTDPFPATVSVSYAGAGFTLSDGLGNTSRYATDPNGLITSLTDALGSQWSYQYQDGAARVTSRTEPGGATLQATYDSRNRLATAASGASSLAFDYSGLQRDGLNRLAGSTDSFGNQIQYSYDAAGRLAGMTLPGGNTISYQYDAAGRLAKVTDWLGDFALYKYDPTGLVTSVTTSSGPVTLYQYDPAGNLKSLVSAGADGSVVAGYRYNTLDPNGNPLKVDVAPATAPPQVNPAATSYDPDNRPASRADGASYRYDAGGRLVGIDGPQPASFSYDAFGRLGSVAAASTAQYSYDALGLRVERNANGVVRRFVYDLSGPRPRVAVETDGSNAPVAYYVYGLGLLWKIAAAGNTIYYYHFDGNGNVVAVSSPTGGVLNRYRYDAPGRLIASDESVENSFHQRGESGWIDDGDGLLYGDGNYYSPELRRTLPGTVDLNPPYPALVPRFTGALACFTEGLSQCALASGRRER